MTRIAFIQPVILHIVAQRYGLARASIRSDRRDRLSVRVRWAVIWLLTRHSHASLSGIGRIVNRDHSTVISSLRAMRVLPENDPFRDELAELDAELRELLASGRIGTLCASEPAASDRPDPEPEPQPRPEPRAKADDSPVVTFAAPALVRSVKHDVFARVRALTPAPLEA